MILTKTPLRISFFGGGTDLPSHYGSHGGAVLSTTIDKYMYIALNKTNPEVSYIQLSYSDIEYVSAPEYLQHDIARNILLDYYDDEDVYPFINTGLEISSFADIPTVGTGLGSSSAYACGLLRALGPNRLAKRIAHDASIIEIVKCGSPIGKQDQYAAAFGGFNFIEFNSTDYWDPIKRDDLVQVNPVTTDVKGLEENLFLYYTGITRSANVILADQNHRNPINTRSLNMMAHQAKKGLEYLVQARYDDFGMMLHEAWEMKKNLSSLISNDEIDSKYNFAMQSGALGGKLLGAGGGGYFLFYVPKKSHTAFRKKMAETNMRQIDFKFSKQGASVVYDSRV